jgi:hypothetical protein
MATDLKIIAVLRLPAAAAPPPRLRMSEQETNHD